MGGINRIQEQREEQRSGINTGNQAVGREIWFKDGDQAFMTALATGHEDDTKLDEFYIYTYRSGNRWVNLLSDPDTDTSMFLRIHGLATSLVFGPLFMK